MAHICIIKHKFKRDDDAEVSSPRVLRIVYDFYINPREHKEKEEEEEQRLEI